MATTTHSGSSGSGQEAKQKADEAKEQAKQKAGELTDQAKEQAKSQLASQKERASSSLGSISKALHQASDKLRDEDQSGIAGYVDDAAGQVEEFARTLQDRSVGELLQEAQRYARREPALFLGGAMVVGLFGARFLKSSSPESNRYGRRGDRYYSSGRRSPYRGSSSRGVPEGRYGDVSGERRTRVYTPTEAGETGGTGARPTTGATTGAASAQTSGRATVTPSSGAPTTAAARRGEEDKDNG